MTTPDVRPVDGEADLLHWRYVHNLVVPPCALALAEVRERARRNHLEIALLDGEPIGCSTVRPPASATARDAAAATVIARVLPAHRGRGLGAHLYERGLRHALALGARTVETFVLEAAADGLRFAARRGFTEVERYPLTSAPDARTEVHLRLATPGDGSAGGGA
ncbi:GNAT family N-acetyltransferase [Streptomyces sp. NPDC090306]|uniref:GNAT family N-acetyltransferase n=1 Tax=Streptomyces sp. NPDC090306 TaxID=3365961 RepID=UPI0037F5466B